MQPNRSEKQVSRHVSRVRRALRMCRNGLILIATLPHLVSADSITLISKAVPSDTPGPGAQPVMMSADGRYVAVASAAAHWLPGVLDANGTRDAFLFDRVTGTTTLISHAFQAPMTAANGESYPLAISADGQFVLLMSTATNLIAGAIDSPGTHDTFLWQRSSGTVTLVSHVAGSPNRVANGWSDPIGMSTDGQSVLFASSASNLILGQTDTNGRDDAFLWDRSTDTVGLISHVPGAPTTSGNEGAQADEISGDGLYVTFQSRSTDLIPGGMADNGGDQVFLWARLTGEVRLISHAFGSPTTAANGASYSQCLSADGQYVAFGSAASDLASIDANGTYDVFLWERSSDTVTLVSHAAGSATTAANMHSQPELMSADGEYLAFQSDSTDLIAGGLDTNEAADAFLWQRSTGTVTLVSSSLGSPTTSANDESGPTGMSADGRYLAFYSFATDVLAGLSDTNNAADAFLLDRTTGVTTMISHRAGVANMTANGGSFAGLSADGGFGSLRSFASDLVSGSVDTNHTNDAFLWERATGGVSLISRLGGPGSASGSGASQVALVSADGQYTAFQSDASNLFPESVESYGATDVYLWERATGTRTLVSHIAASSTVAAGRYSYPVAISADGEFVVFQSTAASMVAGGVDTNQGQDVFLWDRSTDTVTLVSHAFGSTGVAANEVSVAVAMSANGQYVLFGSFASNLVAGTSHNAFLWERSTGTVQALGASIATQGNLEPIGISADGQYATFASSAADLIPGGTDTNTADDVFLWQRSTGAVTLISHSAGSTITAANQESFPTSIANDGQLVLFYSSATNLVANGTDINGGVDAFLWERATGNVSLLSHLPGSATTAANGNSYPSALSGGSDYAIFQSTANNLIDGGTDTNSAADAFLWQRATGLVSLISHAWDSPVKAANLWSVPIAISADGQRVALESVATNLVAGVDADSNQDAFVWERATGTVTLISHAFGAPTKAADRPSYPTTMSADGQYVAMQSAATDLVPAEFNGNWQVFLWSGAASPGNLTITSKPSTAFPVAQAGSFTVTSAGAPTASLDMQGTLPMGVTFSDNGDGTAVVSGSPALGSEGSYPLRWIATNGVGADAEQNFTLNVTTGAFSSVPPCRIFDSRLANSFPLRAELTRLLTVAGGCGIPVTARALSVNVTAVEPSAEGTLQIFPGDQAPPLPPLLNFSAGRSRANNAIVQLALDTSGRLGLLPDFGGGGGLDVVVDVNGYFE